MTDSSSHQDAPAVALLPYGTRITLRLARIPLDALHWPAGRPQRLMAGTISDLGHEDHLLVYLNSRLLYMPRPGVRARVSVLVVEPQAVHGRKFAWLKLLWRRFHLVLSSNAGVLATVPNSTRFLFGSTWVPDWRKLNIVKTRMVSLIASGKDYYPGHKLRHQVVAWARDNGVDVDILGRGYTPFEKKSDGLAPYRYSIIIENVREPGYITEKLIDCLLCETVPIYWGDPAIGDVFDLRGMIVATDLAAITAAIDRLSEDDYQARLEFVRLNRDKASRYADHEKAAARIVLRESARSRKSAS